MLLATTPVTEDDNDMRRAGDKSPQKGRRANEPQFSDENPQDTGMPITLNNRLALNQYGRLLSIGRR